MFYMDESSISEFSEKAFGNNKSTLDCMGTGVLILSKGKIADRIPIFFKVFYIVSHTPILPFERIKTSVVFSRTCTILLISFEVWIFDTTKNNFWVPKSVEFNSYKEFLFIKR